MIRFTNVIECGFVGLFYSHRLRRVMRQAMVTSRKWFNQDASLLLELSQRVADMMGGVYPELSRNLSNVHMLLRFEEDVFREHLSKSGREWSAVVNRFPELSALPTDQQPGLIAGLRQLEDWRRSSDTDKISGSLAFKLYSTHGLQEDSLQLLVQLKGWNVDWPQFHQLMADERMSTKIQSSTAVSSQFQCATSLKVAPTIWQCQDVCSRDSEGHYIFEPFDATAKALISQDGRTIEEAAADDDRIAVIADKSCFYYEAGGQVSDTGRLLWPTGAGQVEEVRRVGDHIYHLVKITEGSLRVDQRVRMMLDENSRLNTMANHTATHLLQAAIKDILKVTCQKSSHVTPEHFRFDFGLFQSEFTLQMISQAESSVRNWICKRLAVDRLMLPLHQAVSLDGITLVPGESYPDMISVIRVAEESGKGEAISLEPCCGTHVRNTADLEEFAILSVKSAGIGSRSVRAVTRSSAKQSLRRADDLKRELNLLEDVVNKCNSVEFSQLKVTDQLSFSFRYLLIGLILFIDYRNWTRP
jgi:alanyl-tRNA synthetase